MSKRKLSNKQIIELAATYINDNDVVTLEYLASMYGVSESTISNALHYAISNCLVNEKTARSIAAKAIRHDTIRREKYGYSQSNKVKNFYDKLLEEYLKKRANEENLKNLQGEYVQLQFQLDTFDDTFSSSDEYPYDKNEIQCRMDNLENEIKKNKGQY